MDRTTAGVLSTLAVLVMVGLFAFIPSCQARAEIDSLIQQTQVAASLGEISDNLTDVIGAMERRGATSGYSNLIDRVPENDIGLDYQAIIRIRDRAELLRNEDVFSTTYNVALDDIRGTLREIDVNAFGWQFWANPAGWIFTILIALCIIVFVGLALVSS